MQFAKATGINANADHLINHWRDANRRALNSLEDLKTNPVATGLGDIPESLMSMHDDGEWWLPSN